MRQAHPLQGVVCWRLNIAMTWPVTLVCHIGPWLTLIGGTVSDEDVGSMKSSLHCVIAVKLCWWLACPQRATGTRWPLNPLCKGPLDTSGSVLESHLICCFLYQPSPIKKERSPRPQSFCHSSSISPQDKLALPGFSTPRDKQRLSYGAFTNQIFVSTDSPTSPTSEAPPLPPRNAGKGTGLRNACGFDLMAASLP